MNVMTAMKVPPGPARFTAAEFRQMAEAWVFGDIKLELIRGELQRMPPPGNTHARLQAVVLIALAGVIASHLVRGEIGIDCGDDTIVGADAVILADPTTGIGWITASDVSLVVEIAVTTRDRDLGLKRRLYAAAGIPTYWVVDAERAVIHVFDRPQGEDYLGLALVRFGEPLAVPGTDRTIVLE